MKTTIPLLTFVLSLAYSVHLPAQHISPQEYNVIIKALQTSEWKQVEKLSTAYLKRFKPTDDSSYNAANIRYMYLVGVAGQLGHKDITKDEALKKVKSLKDRMIITPARMVKEKGIFNYLKIDSGGMSISSCRANDEGTEIEIFEHYKRDTTASPLNADELEGKKLRIRARISVIVAGGYAMPRLEINFTEAVIGTDD